PDEPPPEDPPPDEPPPEDPPPEDPPPEDPPPEEPPPDEPPDKSIDAQPLASTTTIRAAASSLNRRQNEPELLIMFIDLAPLCNSQTANEKLLPTGHSHSFVIA
ncbi:MAG: hypothetical protein V3S54_07895, partial [Woeseiaceae bacterium]